MCNCKRRGGHMSPAPIKKDTSKQMPEKTKDNKDGKTNLAVV